MKAMHTKDYLRIAISRRKAQGYEYTSVPALYNIVRELMLKDGKEISPNLRVLIQSALYKACP